MDFQKLSYDLALIYAKAKFEDALSKGKVPIAMSHPQILEDEEFLAKTFSDAYLDFLNCVSLFEEIREWEPKLRDNNE